MIFFSASTGMVAPRNTRTNARTSFIVVVDHTSDGIGGGSLSLPRRSHSAASPSTDPNFARELTVVFQECLLPLQFFGGGLHVTLFIGHARHDCMLPRLGALPGVGEQL